LQRKGLSFGGKLRGLVEVVAKEAQLGVPFRPLFLGAEQVIANVAEELNLHDVDLLHCNARDLGPRLIGISVIVEICC
jgi:hypothetical protein